MNKGWIVWLVLIVVVAAMAYVYTGFNFGLHSSTTTAASTTVPKSNTVTTSGSTSLQPYRQRY